MEDESVIDPRIKQELECLNSTSLKINDLENKINEKRSQYRTALASSTQRLNALAQKLGDCVNKARPYYNAKRIAKQAHNEAQQAAIHFERAASMHNAAREMVTVAERGMGKDCHDTAWADMLNHAIGKVNEAEADRYRSEFEHLKRAEAFKEAEEKVKKLQKSLKSNIKKSQPYFEMKKLTQHTLETISISVHEVEEELKKSKQLYSTTLHNLEEISDSIHASRALSSLTEEQNSMLLGQRQDGVGAETPFNEQEIIVDLSKKLESGGSNVSVLNDLRETDSIDQLSSLNDSSSLDVISYTSSISQSSSMSTGASTASDKPNCSKNKSEIDPTKTESETTSSSDTTTTCTTSTITSTSSDEGANDSYKQTIPSINIDEIDVSVNSSNSGSKLVSISSPSSNQQETFKPTSEKSSLKSNELVLSIAGLGEVSSKQ